MYPATGCSETCAPRTRADRVSNWEEKNAVVVDGCGAIMIPLHKTSSKSDGNKKADRGHHLDRLQIDVDGKGLGHESRAAQTSIPFQDIEKL